MTIFTVHTSAPWQKVLSRIRARSRDPSALGLTAPVLRPALAPTWGGWTGHRGCAGEAGASLPGSRSNQYSPLDRAWTPEDAYLVCIQTRIRAPQIALGPGLELPGLHLDSPPESARIREGFARQQRSPGLAGQQGDPTKLSL